MQSFFKKVFRNKKKLFFLLFFFLLTLCIPVTGYFVTSERNFDERGMAKDVNLGLELKFEASPEVIKVGDRSTLEWDFTWAEVSVASFEVYCKSSGGWSGDREASGSQSVAPTKTTTYTLTCEKDSQKITRSVTVKVQDLKLEFDATPNAIKIGDKSTLKWDFTWADLQASSVDTSCEASGAWSGKKNISGSESVSPEKTSTYTLTCKKGNLQVTQSVIVSVHNLELKFEASPKSIKKGQESTLKWDFTWTEIKPSGSSTQTSLSCQASGGWTGEKKPSGSEIVSPKKETKYDLFCKRGVYEMSSSVTVGIFCDTSEDCQRKAPYEICFQKSCINGDVNNDGKINVNDFVEFKKDFTFFKEVDWRDTFKRSDLNNDQRISMADYSIFVRSYRLFNKID